MMHLEFMDTIAAIATPPGEGGIGIVRISGDRAVEIADMVFKPKSGNKSSDIKSRRVTYGYVIDRDGNQNIDEALMTIMRAPYSYTMEDVVEISCHGGFMSVKKTLDCILKSGARLAEPGEFTKRAFLNGRIDLSQAEAVMDIISSKTDMSLSASVNQLQGNLTKEIKKMRDKLLEMLAKIEANIDFPEEDIEEVSLKELEYGIDDVLKKIRNLLDTSEAGMLVKNGIKTVIVGRPNVGKSSLMNALLKQQRAIVTDVPGTTRDLIEEYINIKGILMRIIDTAGLRDSHDLVEKIGVQKTKETIQQADLIIFVIDGSEKITDEDRKILDIIKDKKVLIIINKIDLAYRVDIEEIKEFLGDKSLIKASAKENIGMDIIEDAVADMVFKGEIKMGQDLMITNMRHKLALEQAEKSLEKAMNTLNSGLPIDFISIDIRETWMNLGKITGDTVEEDVIDKIFKDFCIGK